MIKQSDQPWTGLWALFRSLGLPRKRFLVIGMGCVIVLMYSFITYANSAHPNFGLGDFYSSHPESACSSPSVLTSTAESPNKAHDGVAHGPEASRNPSQPPPSSSSSLPSSKHPIPGLMKTGESKWDAMLKSQSHTLDAAVAEYKRRYKVAPPDGFDLWFKYAKENNVKLVDEYDDLMAVLAPLRKLGPKEVRRRAENMLKFGLDVSLGGLVVDGSKGVFTYWDPAKVTRRSVVVIGGEDSNGGYRTSGFLQMLGPVKELLATKVSQWPAFAIPVNELAEARVVGGDDSKWKKDTDALVMQKKAFGVDDLWHMHAAGSRSLADDLAKTCGSDSRYGKMVVGSRFEFGIQEVLGSKDGGLKGEGTKPGFVEDPKADNDMCKRPELMALHGVFRGTRVTTKGLYPILSYGRPSAFSDIPIPSRYQWDEDGSYEYYAGDDRPWNEKESKIYWRGEPSGGGHGDNYYGSMHRHRLVALTNPQHFKTDVTLTGATASGHLIQTTEPAHVAQTLTNITFSDISEMCAMFGCDLVDIFPFEPRNEFSEAWKNKLVVDSDGWGPSGRWRALLSSGSLAIRSSIYREWFSGVQMPWVHYVPASVGLGELWDLLGFFLGTAEGGVSHDREAKKIAEQGAQYVAEHMRRQDMTAYCFRLLLELNRLFNGEQWVYKG